MELGLSGGVKLREKLEEIQKKVGTGELLRVGFLENSTYPGTSEQTAYIAAINEFGNPANNQPPRPFFRSMVESKKSGWGVSMAKVMKATGCDVNASFIAMGEGIRAQLKQSIIDLVNPPLAKSTILARASGAKHGQITSPTIAKPLIDTGHLLSSADYDIKQAGE